MGSKKYSSTEHIKFMEPFVQKLFTFNLATQFILAVPQSFWVFLTHTAQRVKSFRPLLENYYFTGTLLCKQSQ